jgi:GNAT superfamily N-acetyltransferase
MSVVRRARPEDADALAELNVRAWWRAFATIVDEQRLATALVHAPQEWHKRLDGGLDGECVVVEDDDGTVRGWATIGPARDPGARPNEGELLSLYVDPEHLRQGFGHALLREAERRLRGAGHDSAALWAFTPQQRSARFFERHGWIVDERALPSPFEVPCTRYRKRL